MNKLVIALTILLVSTFDTFAQNSQKYTPLESILTSLEERLGVSFTFADETIKDIYLAPPADSLTIEEAILYLRQNTSLDIRQLNNRFITISKASAQTIAICSYVLDAKDKTPITGATIQVGNQYKVSDLEGYFEIQEVPVSDIVFIRILGYDSLQINPEELQRGGICKSIWLNPTITQLDEVMIQNYITAGINKKLNGSFEVNVNKLGILPGLIEPDVLQTIQALPGIQSINETVSHINVRGGTNDQNLVLWDGIKMYQTGHFFGLISAFNPYQTRSVSLIKNGTSTALNGGVSSIISIKSDEQVSDKVSGQAGLNLLNGDALLNIPLSKKMSLQVAGRRAITDVVASPVFDNYFERAFGNTDVTNTFTSGSDTTFNSDENFFFYDVGANLVYDISKKDKLQVNFLNLFNELEYQENIESNAATDSKTSSLKQQSIAAGIDFKRLWNKNFRTTFSSSLSSYSLKSVNFDVLNNQRVIQENEVLDLGLNAEALWRINNQWDILSGYQFKEVGVGNLEDINNPEFRRHIKEVVRTHVLFSEVNYLSKNDKTNVRFGVRANYLNKFNKTIIEPRLAFNQRFLTYFSFEILGEFKSQTATQIIDLQNDFLGVEKRRWVLANENDIPIVQSKQASAGIHYNHKELLVSFEGFYKMVSGITSSSQGFQNQFQYIRASGNYNVSGFEFLVNKQFDNFSTWLGYSYTDNTYEFSTFNPPVFPNNLDITHTITSGASAKVKNIELSLGVNWRTGKPYTLTEGVDGNEILYQSPNNANLANYLRVDFSGWYNFKLGKKTRAKVGASVWNLTNHQNVINTYYILDEDENIKEVQEFALGITLNLMFRVSFNI